ncbi:MAG: hypothetical protein IH587_07530, partial [Anaerolineae bacterium]|nr:hypothetical protein [Anaerolineae bacterium]
GRDFQLLLNNEPIAGGIIDASTTMRIPLPLIEQGYYTIALAVSPPCPAQIAPGQICRALDVEALEVGGFVEADYAAPSLFEHGISLAGHAIAPRADHERLVPIWLWWKFAEPRTQNDVRFVHVLDAAGNLVAQHDGSLGSVAENTARSEEVIVALPDDLPSGEYQIVTGWYNYPDIIPYRVLDGDSSDTAVLLGRFILAEAEPTDSASN